MIRSYLFVPAHNQRFVAQAHLRGADAIILDLEDSVPPSHKAVARAGLVEAVGHLAEKGIPVLVRINSGLGDCVRDLEAACIDGVSALVLPKVEGPDHVRLVTDYMQNCEASCGRTGDSVGLIALIETPAGILHAASIASASDRVLALALGGEDLATNCGFTPEADILDYWCNQLVLAARFAGVTIIGLPGSIAQIGAIEEFRHNANRARRMGVDAIFCIHPSQVLAVNDVFAPTQQELEAAQILINDYNACIASGSGAMMLDGKMVDLPVVKRAEAMLRQDSRRKIAS